MLRHPVRSSLKDMRMQAFGGLEIQVEQQSSAWFFSEASQYMPVMEPPLSACVFYEAFPGVLRVLKFNRSCMHKQGLEMCPCCMHHCKK